MITLEGLMKFGLAVFALYFLVTLLLWQLLAFGLLVLSICVISLGIYLTRNYRQEQELMKVRAFLSSLKSNRQSQQEEAAQIWRAFVENDKSPRGDILLKGTIEWRLLDFDLEGSRLLVTPANRRYATFAALVGVDFKTRRSFLMPVPTHAATISMAMEYLWNLRPGSVGRGEIYEV